MDNGERTDKKGGKQRNLPRGGYDSRGVVFRKTRYGVFRLPKARAIRVHRAVYIVCVSRVYAYRAAVYLENTRIRGGESEMFGWLQDLLRSIVDAITGGFASAAKAISDSIWNAMMRWLYNSVYSAIADFFTMMGNMGAEIFDLAWIRAIVQLFTLFGWGLFTAGAVVAIFDLAVEYQSGRANIKNTLLNILKGFFACSLIGLVPIELYKFCISLQNTFAGELARIFSWQSGIDFSSRATIVLGNTFAPLKAAGNLLLNVCLLIAFAYCVIKVFFQNIKRGGILLVQMSVGSLYMFSVPRGYTDGFVQWMKQVAALCLTAFMQTTLLFAGLMTFSVNMLLGLGIMLAASEVPRIAQQFGLDSSTKFNMMNVVHATTTAINLSRAIARSGK